MLRILIYLILSLGSAFAPILTTESAYVVIIGDFGITDNESSIKHNAVESIKKLNTIRKFDIGLVLGDNVYPRGIRDKNYEPIKNIFTDPFDRKHFNIPFLSVLGNHDHMGDINNQIEYAGIDPRWYMPSRYYHIDFQFPLSGKTIAFIVTDSTPILDPIYLFNYNIEDMRQLSAIHDYFIRSKNSSYVWLLSHHSVLRSYGPHFSPPDNPLRNLAEIHHPTAILSGHNHNLQFIVETPTQGYDISQIIVGSASKLSKIKSKCEFSFCHDSSGGFATLNITPQQATLLFYDEHGNLMHETNFAPKN